MGREKTKQNKKARIKKFISNSVQKLEGNDLKAKQKQHVICPTSNSGGNLLEAAFKPPNEKFGEKPKGRGAVLLWEREGIRLLSGFPLLCFCLHFWKKFHSI